MKQSHKLSFLMVFTLGIMVIAYQNCAPMEARRAGALGGNFSFDGMTPQQMYTMNQSQSLQLNFAETGFQVSAECRVPEGATHCDPNQLLSGSIRGVTSDEPIDFVANGTTIGSVQPPEDIEPDMVLGFSVRIPNGPNGLAPIGVNPLIISVRQNTFNRGSINFLARCPNGMNVPNDGCAFTSSTTPISGFSLRLEPNTPNQCRLLANLTVNSVASGRCIQIFYQHQSNSELNEVSDMICSPRTVAFAYPFAQSANFAGAVKAIVREVNESTGLPIRDLQQGTQICPGTGTQSTGAVSASIQNLTAAASGSNCTVTGRVQISDPVAGQTNPLVCAVLRVPNRAPHTLGSNTATFAINSAVTPFEAGSVEVFRGTANCATQVGSVLAATAVSCTGGSPTGGIGNPQVVSAQFQAERVNETTCRVSGWARFTGLNDPPGDIRIYGGDGPGYHCGGGTSGEVLHPATQVPAAAFPLTMRIEKWSREPGVPSCSSPASRVGMPLRSEILHCPPQGQSSGSCPQTRCISRADIGGTPAPTTGYFGNFCGSTRTQCGTSAGTVWCTQGDSGCCFRYQAGTQTTSPTCDPQPQQGIGSPQLTINTVGAVPYVASTQSSPSPQQCKLSGMFGYSGLNGEIGDVRLYANGILNSCGGGSSGVVSVNPAVFTREPEPGARIKIEVHTRPAGTPACTDLSTRERELLPLTGVTCPPSSSAALTGITATSVPGTTACQVNGQVVAQTVTSGMSIQVQKITGGVTSEVTCLTTAMGTLNGPQPFTSTMAIGDNSTFKAQIKSGANCGGNPIGTPVQAEAACNAAPSGPQPSNPQPQVDIFAVSRTAGGCELKATISGLSQTAAPRSVCMRRRNSTQVAGHGNGSNLPLGINLASTESATFDLFEIAKAKTNDYCTPDVGGASFPIGMRTASCTAIPTPSPNPNVQIFATYSSTSDDCALSANVSGLLTEERRSVCIRSGGTVVGGHGNGSNLTLSGRLPVAQQRTFTMNEIFKPHQDNFCQVVEGSHIFAALPERSVTCTRTAPTASPTVSIPNAPTVTWNGLGCAVSGQFAVSNGPLPSGSKVCVYLDFVGTGSDVPATVSDSSYSANVLTGNYSPKAAIVTGTICPSTIPSGAVSGPQFTCAAPSTFTPSTDVRVTPSVVDPGGTSPCVVKIGVSGLSPAAPTSRAACVTMTGAATRGGAFGNGMGQAWNLENGNPVTVPRGGTVSFTAIERSEYCSGEAGDPATVSPMSITCPAASTFTPSTDVRVTPSVVDPGGTSPCTVKIGVSGLSSAAPTSRAACVTMTGAATRGGAFGNGMSQAWNLENGNPVTVPRGGTVSFTAIERSEYCSGEAGDPATVSPMSITCPAPTGTCDQTICHDQKIHELCVAGTSGCLVNIEGCRYRRTLEACPTQQ